MTNFMEYHYKFRQNLKIYDIDSMINKPYDSLYTNHNPKISIIMTVYNKGKYVNDSIKSILRQTYKNIELVIVEDMSVDNSRDIVKTYENKENIKIVYNNENMGCYVSRNLGIKNASGTIIGFQDADDYAISTKIEKQVKMMIEEKLSMVGTDMIRSHLNNINYENDDKILYDVYVTSLPNKHKTKVCCKNMFGYPTLIIKKELFDKYGLYIEKRKGMDTEFPERVLFKECKIKFPENYNSWNFFNERNNKLYKKLNEVMVISPEMSDNNLTNNVKSDEYSTKWLWRNDYM